MRRCHIPAGVRLCGTIRSFLLRETPAELSTDEAQGEIQGHTQPPMTPTSRILNPHNDESSMALHTRFGSLGPFSLRETNPKNAQTTSTVKYGSAQPPRPQLAPYMTTKQVQRHTPASADARFGGCLARLGSFSLHQTRQGQNTGARAATQDPNLQLPTIYMNQTRCHTPAEAARHLMRSPSPECPAPKYDDQPNLVPHTRFGGCDNIRSPLTPTHEAILPRAQICQSARISCARVCTTTQMNEVTEEKESHTRCGPYPAHHRTKPKQNPLTKTQHENPRPD
ncbi:hypothetical protein BS47DRAFT_1368709 [Hydnum rufescens UP504]|uniref:Uncharacterized protein n=1 Tax=Hydnum rufescens UP504 TaxID=1448309 RepID=A0A9P6AES0_9AGAM|nr:hypothetical protein BS47DRAFT_1368709 [Hydnum rufescens UP504]